jgi:hypothetical protein
LIDHRFLLRALEKFGTFAGWDLKEWYSMVCYGHVWAEKGQGRMDLGILVPCRLQSLSLLTSLAGSIGLGVSLVPGSLV